MSYMTTKYITAVILLSIIAFSSYSQDKAMWKNKKCAVALTYDDAIDVDLNNAIPVLDSLNLKATFYIIGASPVVNRRLNEWKKAAANGHELGNHSLFHPCDGSKPGRGFVTPETDLSRYTVSRAVNEAR